MPANWDKNPRNFSEIKLKLILVHKSQNVEEKKSKTFLSVVRLEPGIKFSLSIYKKEKIPEI